MTDNSYIKPKKRHSLYFSLIFNIILGVTVAAAVYICLRLASGYIINSKYLSDEAKYERLEAHLYDLQSYATRNNISSEDTDKIAYWAKQNPYVYLMVYKNDLLFFYSDMDNEKDDEDTSEDSSGDTDSDGSGKPDGDKPADGSDETDGADSDSPENTEGSYSDKTDNKNDTNKNDSNFGSLGLGGNKVDRETLINQAKASGMHPIELKDGTIFAEIADFSEELYFSLANLFSMAAGIMIFAIILILYFRKIVARLKRLESDVNIVSHINMNHSIVCDGRDEISMLSRNVENMRNSILENLEKERTARAANTELVTAMSHDIRTPLTVLLGYIDILKNYEGCDETVKSYIGATEKTAMRLKELSDDMFKYSLAYGSTDEQIALENYDAGMLMEQLFYEHILLLSDNGYIVNYDREMVRLESGTTVYTDPQNLMRIIDNVFQNIYKYADKSAPVDFLFEVEKERICFTIKNKLKEEPSAAESNGVGLKTCKRLAQYIADEFNYENDGESFTVTLALKIKNRKQKNRNVDI